MSMHVRATSKSYPKKKREKLQVERFLEARGFEHLSVEPELEPNGWPDQWIRIGDAADIAVEVTEYRPRVKVGKKADRSTIQARCDESLLPKIHDYKIQFEELHDIQACLYFKDRDLAPKHEHAKIAKEVVRFALQYSSKARTDKDVQLPLFPRGDLDRLPPGGVAEEDWPGLRKRIARIVLRRRPGIKWPTWTCPGVNCSFISPSSQEFDAILKGKALQAGGHNPTAHPLWLLIVSDVPNDISSHIFPRYDHESELLQNAVTGCKFDFAHSPFAEVWLTSDESGNGIRLDQMKRTTDDGAT